MEKTRMQVELAEDENARRYRVESYRAASIEYKRAIMRYGFPICLFSAVLVYFLIPERRSTAVVLMGVLPLLLMAFLPIVSFMPRLFRNRWRITDEALHLRGEKYGKIRWSKVASWQIQRLPKLPGYYEIRIRGLRTGYASIILAENLWEMATFEALAPTSIKNAKSGHDD